jgi:hypothetical protein
MDETTQRRQEHLAKCQEAIEKSREMIAVSLRWLTAYRDSVKSGAAKPRQKDAVSQKLPLS